MVTIEILDEKVNGILGKLS